MKNQIHFNYTSALIIVLLSCNSGPADPVKEAKKENTQKIDSQMTNQRHVDSVAVLPSKKDAEFLINAASGGMFEVELGQLAQTNARNQRVKNFGAMMIKDHGESGEKLKTLAASKNITLPDSIANRQQKEKQRLRQKKGDVFDAAYIDMMVDDHKKDIREFEQEAANGTNPDIKTFASDHLRMLQTHLDSAVSIQRVVSKMPVTPDIPPGPYR